MAKMKVMGGGMTCKCTPGGFVWLIIGVIVLALGFWAVVKGLQMQWEMRSMFNWMIAFWYALGFLVICIGKMIKMKGCSGCPAHSV